MLGWIYEMYLRPKKGVSMLSNYRRGEGETEVGRGVLSLKEAAQVMSATQRQLDRGKQFEDFPQRAAQAVTQVVLETYSLAEGCQRIVTRCYRGFSTLDQAPDEIHESAIQLIANHIRPHVVYRITKVAPNNGCRALLELALDHVEWELVADMVRAKLLNEMFKK